MQGLISAPLIPAGIWWNKIWQEGLLFFFILVPFILAEFGHSGIETGMFCGICRNGMQRNLVVCLFVSHLLPNKPPTKHHVTWFPFVTHHHHHHYHHTNDAPNDDQ